MTQAGTLLGTPAYMSPEQFMGQVVDARTDIYSSGVLLYQLLTGDRPFEGGMSAIMHKALNTEPPVPSLLSVTAPPSFDAVVRRAMAKRPEDRFPSAGAFAEAIRVALAAHAEPAVHEDEATMIAAPPRAGCAALDRLPDRRRTSLRRPRPALTGAGHRRRGDVARGCRWWCLVVPCGPAHADTTSDRNGHRDATTSRGRRSRQSRAFRRRRRSRRLHRRCRRSVSSSPRPAWMRCAARSPIGRAAGSARCWVARWATAGR